MFARAIRPGASSRAASRCIPRPLQRTMSLASTSPATPMLRHSLTTRRFPVSTPRSHRCALSSQHKAQPSGAAREYIPDTPIRVLRTAADVHAWRSEIRSSSSPLGDEDPGLAFVPTMGALHEGHITLIREAAARGHNKILVSIYVNPAQFGVAEDLDSYPKTWEGDCAVLTKLFDSELANLKAEGAIAVFAPTTAEIYPSGFPGQEPDSKGSFVTITPVGELLEGKTRPTFFRGVATVCMKLFNIVRPDRVFFGQKDVQQTVVIRKMVRDFCMPIDVAVVPTVREPGDGLALSSRNVYLGTRRRRVAPVLVTALRAAEKAYLDGANEAGEIVPTALKVLLAVLEQQMKLSPGESVMFKMDYISLADPDTMEELEEVDPAKGAILSGAIKMLPVVDVQDGEDLGLNNGPPVRLIDNLILPPRV